MQKNKRIYRRPRTVGQPEPAIPYISAFRLLAHLEHHAYPGNPWRVGVSVQEETLADMAASPTIESTGTLLGIASYFRDNEFNLYFVPILETVERPIHLKFRTHRHRGRYHEKYSEMYEYDCDAYASKDTVYEIHDRPSFPDLKQIITQLQHVTSLNPDAAVYLSNPIADFASPIVGVCFEPESATVILRASAEYYEEQEEIREAVLAEETCDAPDWGPDWPIPKNHANAMNLISYLPPKLKVIAALVAAELVLPLWKDAFSTDTFMEELINVSNKALREEASEKQLVLAMNDVATEVQGAVNYHQAMMFFSIIMAAGSVLAYLNSATTRSQTNAMESVGEASVSFQKFRNIDASEFYKSWWREFRCRVARENIEYPTTGGLHETTALTTKGKKEHISRDPLPVKLESRDDPTPLLDSAWPPPTNKDELEHLIAGFGWEGKIAFSLIAADLVVSILGKYARNAKDILNTIDQWLRGNVESNEMLAAKEEADSIAESVYNAEGDPASPAVWAAGSVAWAAWTAIELPVRLPKGKMRIRDWPAAWYHAKALLDYATWAVWTAAVAAEKAGWLSEEEFYALWWQECQRNIEITNLIS